MSKKLIIILCLVLSSSLYLPIVVSANEFHTSEYIGIAPFWQNVQSITPMMEIHNGAATMAGLVIGNMGVESISVNATLVRVNTNGTTTHIASWSNLDVTGRFWGWERTHFVARWHDYRLTLTATVVLGGVSEVVSNSVTVRAH